MLQGTGLIVISLFCLIVLLFGLQYFFTTHPKSPLLAIKKWLYTIITFLGLTVIFSFLPIENTAKSSVFALLGLVITAVIAISSTTFVSNAMAGTMLRIIR